jgi:SAM-dependent methyltransferase
MNTSIISKAIRKIPYLRRIPYLTEQVTKLQKEVTELQNERDSLICGVPSSQDDDISPDYSPVNNDWQKYISDHFDYNKVKVLEIGSRLVTSTGYQFEHLCKRENYVGFDVGEGENVDVVGDAHKLSSYFHPDSFDVVFSSAVFEHLAMPWVVAEEISKVLKPGGLVLTFTHFSFAEHELPWHFFQFNKAALRCLFNPVLGYEEVECYHCLPMIGRFSNGCPEDLRGKVIGNLYCSTHHLARKKESSKDFHGSSLFDWRSSLDDVYQGTKYPGT